MRFRSGLSLFFGFLLILGVTVPAAAGTGFVDVPDTNPFAADITWLSAAGITKGCNPPTNDKFCPKDNITREQMAAFLVRALGLTNNGGGNTFTDDNGSPFENDIAKIAAAGITKGCNPPTNDKFCPKDNITREQVAAFLHRALDQPPGAVAGLVVTLSGGSGEVDVSWTVSSETDIDHYNVWFSTLPGGPYTLVAKPLLGPSTRTPDRIFIVDWPRDLTVGKTCYEVSAVDTAAQEGPRSDEACFTPNPGAPNAVQNVTVGLGGGSGEVDVSWTPSAAGDIVSYRAYFSELPGGPYGFVTTVSPTALNGSGQVHFVDWPRDLTVGKTCYVISAYDSEGLEGPQSAEACFDPFA